MCRTVGCCSSSLRWVLLVVLFGPFDLHCIVDNAVIDDAWLVTAPAIKCLFFSWNMLERTHLHEAYADFCIWKKFTYTQHVMFTFIHSCVTFSDD